MKKEKPTIIKDLPPDPRGRAGGVAEWTLPLLLAYAPVKDVLEGGGTIAEVAASYLDPETGKEYSANHLSRLITRVKKLAPDLVPARLRDRARRGSKMVNIYPIFGRVQAGGFNGSDQNTYYKDDPTNESYYTDTDVPDGFALEVRGASMTGDPDSVDFPEGSKVLIRPGVSPEPGEFVLVLDRQDSTTTFKRLDRVNGEEWLVPLNPAYSPFKRDPDNHEFVGVVEEAMKPLYRRSDRGRRRK